MGRTVAVLCYVSLSASFPTQKLSPTRTTRQGVTGRYTDRSYWTSLDCGSANNYYDDDDFDEIYNPPHQRSEGDILTEFDESKQDFDEFIGGEDTKTIRDELELLANPEEHLPPELNTWLTKELTKFDGEQDILEEFDKETMLEILGLNDNGELDLDDLERALARGVVPADAGVGSGMLPCDYGFDPLELSTKDYFKHIQNFILNLVPARKMAEDNLEQEPEADALAPTLGFVGEEDRPPALVLRDYREAEIRHGRLAMLAAIIWPLQELLDRIIIPDSFGHTTMIYGGPTLPYGSLLMMFFMLNLGYLDIYSSEIKENEAGDAFLPGECFWDPLKILDGANERTKRNMQEREILNGRAAMIAVAAFIFEEAMTHKPVVSLPANDLLFVPAFQVPFIQVWLDSQFGNIDYTSTSIEEVGNQIREVVGTGKDFI